MTETNGREEPWRYGCLSRNKNRMDWLGSVSVLALNQSLNEKNLVYQALEYHRKLKKTKKILPLHQIFWLEKDRISHHQKVQNKNFLVVQNKNFSVTRKYHLCINLLSQKDRITIPKKFKTRTFQQPVNIFPSSFWLKKVLIFYPQKFQNRSSLEISKRYSTLKKISYQLFLYPKIHKLFLSS